MQLVLAMLSQFTGLLEADLSLAMFVKSLDMNEMPAKSRKRFRAQLFLVVIFPAYDSRGKCHSFDSSQKLSTATALKLASN